jgi:hypothetical protein
MQTLLLPKLYLPQYTARPYQVAFLVGKILLKCREALDVFIFSLFTVSLYTFPMPNYFTLPEANETLNIIRPLVDEIQEIRQAILRNQPEAWPAIEKSVGNGGNRALSNMVKDFEKLDTLVHQIQDMGVLVKDINLGLLDFPALKDGREVYLCWQYGEGEIAFWHEVEAGFAGRQPIESF